MATENKFILIENGKETGPFTASQIKQRINAGEVSADTICIPKSLFGTPRPLKTHFPDAPTVAINQKQDLKVPKHSTNLEITVKSPDGTTKTSTCEILRQEVLDGKVTADWQARESGDMDFKPLFDVIYAPHLYTPPPTQPSRKSPDTFRGCVIESLPHGVVSVIVIGFLMIRIHRPTSENDWPIFIACVLLGGVVFMLIEAVFKWIKSGFD